MTELQREQGFRKIKYCHLVVCMVTNKQKLYAFEGCSPRIETLPMCVNIQSIVLQLPD